MQATSTIGGPAGVGFFTPAIFEARDEERLLLDFLGPKPGIFVEVGAHDPKVASQTWRLEQAGWTGLLVEPLAEFAERLRAERKAAVAEVACGPPGQHGTVAAFKVADFASTLAPQFINPRVKAAAVRMVPVATLDSLLEQHGIGAVDFLSLDVEGYEVAVLQGFSIERYRPRLIAMEDWVGDLTRHRYLTERGYKVVRRTGHDGWYVPVETEFPVSPFGRFQLFAKYHLARPLRGLRYALRRRWHERRSAGS